MGEKALGRRDWGYFATPRWTYAQDPVRKFPQVFPLRESQVNNPHVRVEYEGELGILHQHGLSGLTILSKEVNDVL